MNYFLNISSFYSLKSRNSSFLSEANSTFTNDSIANHTTDLSSTCPDIEDKLSIPYEYHFAFALFVAPFHVSNIISIMMNRRLHQNVYFLLLNLSISDCISIVNLFNYAAGLSGKIFCFWLVPFLGSVPENQTHFFFVRNHFIRNMGSSCMKV